MVQDRSALLSQRGSAVVLFLPHGRAARLLPSFLQRVGERAAERLELLDLTRFDSFPQRLEVIGERHRADEIVRHHDTAFARDSNTTRSFCQWTTSIS